MKTEIEVKFLNVNFDDLRAKLLTLGAECVQPMRLMRKVLVDIHRRTPEENYGAFLRLRDEGDKVTLTYKEVREHSLTGASEQEIIVSDFDETKAILESIGHKFATYQESRRETWKLDGVEVVLDEWPWLDPYIEIEGDSEEVVQATAKKLEFSWDDAVFGGANRAYAIQYLNAGDSLNLLDIPEIRFGAPLPDLMKPGVK